MTNVADVEDDTDEDEEYIPLRRRKRADIVGMGIPSDEALGISPDEREFDEVETFTFLERIADGWGEYQAGMAAPLSWSPYQIERFIKHPERAKLIWAMREAENESVEQAVRRTAEGGNPTAQKLWLFNKAQHRGWADRRNVKIEGTANIEIVASVKEALNERTREMVTAGGAGGIAALQAAIGLGDSPDEDDDEIVDAELIEIER